MIEEQHHSGSSLKELPLEQASASKRPFKASWSVRAIWLKATPYFLSGALFMSLLFTVFAPLPLLVARYRKTALSWRLLSTLTNSALVGFLGGQDALGIFVWIVLPIVWLLPLLLERMKKVESAVLMTTLSIVVLAAGLIVAEALLLKLSPLEFVQSALNEGLKRVYESVPPSSQEDLLAGMTLEQWMNSLKFDLPWRVVTFCLFWVFANTLILLRWNPSHLRERLGLSKRFFAEWRVPEFLIWPVVVAGALAVLGQGLWAALGMNFLGILLAVFAIQGLSILSFLLDHWKVQGAFRPFVFGASVLLMTPLVLAVGFFDTWFDFRARLRQK
jgi:hypothetical protein